MTLETERSDIEGYFKTQWEALHPSMAIGFDGHEFTPPIGAASVQLEIANGASQQMTFGAPGSNTKRSVGAIIVRIRVPGGLGTATIRALADDVISIFTNKTIGGVETRVPEVSSRVFEAPFLGWSIATPYYRDEHTA